jgi:hypothetical protein
MIWGLIGGVLLSLLASEIYASCPWLTTALLKRAKRALPEEYQDRYWEEWLGELDAQRDFGNLKKLGWALGVFLSSGQTAKTLQRALERGRGISSEYNRAHMTEKFQQMMADAGLEEYVLQVRMARSASEALKATLSLGLLPNIRMYIVFFTFLFRERGFKFFLDKETWRS